MCIKDKKMTNSEVLQFIVEELRKSPLSWNDNKELFEIICTPLSYGHDIYQQRQKAKQEILDIFEDHKHFDIERFNKLADTIICGENQQKYANELLTFLQQQIEQIHINLDRNLAYLVKQIPCKKENEKSYRSSFNNWLNGKTKRINRQEVKQRLEQNFYFSPSLWDQGEYTIKQTIREGVEKFVKNQTNQFHEIENLFKEIKKEFQMKDIFTKEEQDTLLKIETMNQQEVMQYIADHYPLQKHHSQEFILQMIPLLYQKGYHLLWLNDVIEALDPHIKGHKKIKKIQAHIYGSPEVAEYEKAFKILESIHSDDDEEIIDMQTEAISNLRRQKLNDINLDLSEKKAITESIINFYEKVFNYKEQHHYYPGINLAYMLVLHALFSHDHNKEEDQSLQQTINEIYKKALPSIQKEQQSDNLTQSFYANITKLEFMLLKGMKSGVMEVERYLEIEEKSIPLAELSRTQRQMQFFLDHLHNVPYINNNPIVKNILDTVVIIDDFIEMKNTKEILQ